MSVGVIGVISMHTECSVGREVKAVLIGWKLGEVYSCMQRKCRREVYQRTGNRDSICDEDHLPTRLWGCYPSNVVSV